MGGSARPPLPEGPGPGVVTAKPVCHIHETGAPRRHTRAVPRPCQPLPTEAGLCLLLALSAGYLPGSTAPDRHQTPERALLAGPLEGPSWTEGRKGQPPDLRGVFPWPHGSAVLGHVEGSWHLQAVPRGPLRKLEGKATVQGLSLPPSPTSTGAAQVDFWPKTSLKLSADKSYVPCWDTQTLAKQATASLAASCLCVCSSLLSSAPPSTCLLLLQETPQQEHTLTGAPLGRSTPRQENPSAGTPRIPLLACRCSLTGNAHLSPTRSKFFKCWDSVLGILLGPWP